jgi:hypothetical protein
VACRLIYLSRKSDAHLGGNNPNSSLQLGDSMAEIESGYNPYLHGPSKGDYVKNQMLETIAPAIIAQPDLIKVQAIPSKNIYDFTKRSNNMKYLEEGLYDKFEYEERCDSGLKEEDLKKLEIELKKKQKKRIKRESRRAENNRNSRRR